MLNIEQRIERLERSARRWRLACVTLVVTLGTSWLLGAGAVPPARMQTRELVIVDQAGKEVLVIGQDKGEGMITSKGADASVLVKAQLFGLVNDQKEIITSLAAGKSGGSL